MPPFVYSSPHNAQLESHTVVIVLPEIFGLKDQTKEFADRLQNKYGVLAFALDFFYILTATSNDFDYENGAAKGVELAQKMTAKDFDEVLNRSVESIKELHTNVTHFVILGFCFGGALALYSGTNHDISEVVCFYPVQSLRPQFDGEYNIAELVAQKRETILPVNLIFGSEDGSLNEESRATITTILATNPNLRVTSKLYNAGHAFMNSDRPNHNQHAEDESWLFLDQIFSDYSN